MNKTPVTAMYLGKDKISCITYPVWELFMYELVGMLMQYLIVLKTLTMNYFRNLYQIVLIILQIYILLKIMKKKLNNEKTIKQ